MPNRVVHFEIQADEPERAAAFYRAALGWQIDKIDFQGAEYWMVPDQGPVRPVRDTQSGQETAGLAPVRRKISPQTDPLGTY